jgi:copper resistance protein B
VGARLAYDLVDRLVSPYVGVHYERTLGGTAARTIAAGEERGALYLLAGTKIMF